MRPGLWMWPGMIPILHSPGVMTPGQFGPISRDFRRVLEEARCTRTMSSTGMPSVMQMTSAMPASAASMIASAANGGGTKITRRVGAGLLHRLRRRCRRSAPALEASRRPCRA